MRIWVSGGRGFVGRRLVARLEQQGHATAATDLELDVRDSAAVFELLERVDPEAVVHLAAQSSPAKSWQDAAETFRANFLGTLAVLRNLEARHSHARVLLVGSGECYGSGAPGSPAFREQDPLAPRSPYARSKAAAEGLGLAAAGRGLDVVCVRAFNHTGPGQSRHFAAPDFAGQLAEIEVGRRPPRMQVGNLDSVRDWLDVDDVVEAYLQLLRPGVRGGVYNVASGQGNTIRELLDQLLAFSTASPQIVTDPERVRPTDCLVGDATKLSATTGWSPARPLERTLAALLEAARENVGAGAQAS